MNDSPRAKHDPARVPEATDVVAYTLPFAGLRATDVARVGGKNASLGELIQRLAPAGIRVPDGFATTAAAYWAFVDHNDLRGPVAHAIGRFQRDEVSLAETGLSLRGLFLDGEMPPEVAEAVVAGYRALGLGHAGRGKPDVAVRSSATAEDLPEASFAGQHETYLNIRGEAAVLDACRRCFASLFTDRAISYREKHGFDHLRIALSAGVQIMVRSDLGAAGVMFSIDTETGFPDTVVINAAWGLGETVVQGSVDPDEYLVFKPLLGNPGLVPILARKIGAKQQKLVYAAPGFEPPTRLAKTRRSQREARVLDDDEILTLALWARDIEMHYEKPMDMEWAKDGKTGELFVVQARPETIHVQRDTGALRNYRLKAKGPLLCRGLSIGAAIAAGPVCRLRNAADIGRFKDGGVLVTGMTDPDWVPIMKRAAAIVTDHGGRTSHAAIVSRELGLPAVVGTGNATEVLADGQLVTVSCAEGDEGFVYSGIADFETHEIAIDDIPSTRTAVMLNLANPAAALRWWRLPSDGVGLARMEFIIGHLIKIHPMALVAPDRVVDPQARRRIAELTRNWDDKAQYFVDTLARGIARLAASCHPRPIVLRTSDFKTNEYAALIGGRGFEPEEANPMLGWRGASRYYSDDYRAGFALECAAIKHARETIGFDNIIVMIPFCRTPEEADKVLEVMAANGLRRGDHGLQVYVMCELPSNVVLAEEFAQRFDGFSIGSNDLTQLVLGVDRDSDRLAGLFDERHPAVTRMIAEVIATAHRHGRKVGLCGQAPSDHPEFARFLVESGIDSISVNPDCFVSVKRVVADSETPAKP